MMFSYMVLTILTSIELNVKYAKAGHELSLRDNVKV